MHELRSKELTEASFKKLFWDIGYSFICPLCRGEHVSFHQCYIFAMMKGAILNEGHPCMR